MSINISAQKSKMIIGAMNQSSQTKLGKMKLIIIELDWIQCQQFYNPEQEY